MSTDDRYNPEHPRHRELMLACCANGAHAPKDAITIERLGKTTGRWPKYRLVVNGVDLGQVQRVPMGGGNSASSGYEERHDVWRIHGIACSTQEDAEQHLIKRGIRFGHLTVAIVMEVK